MKGQDFECRCLASESGPLTTEPPCVKYGVCGEREGEREKEGEGKRESVSMCMLRERHKMIAFLQRMCMDLLSSHLRFCTLRQVHYKSIYFFKKCVCLCFSSGNRALGKCSKSEVV